MHFIFEWIPNEKNKKLSQCAVLKVPTYKFTQYMPSVGSCIVFFLSYFARVSSWWFSSSALYSTP